MIFAVIVTYKPDHERLGQVLAATRDAVNGVILVDNGSPAIDEERLRSVCPSLVVSRFDTNRGIAAAQNRGIALASSAGASLALFLDQDSVPQPEMVSRLCATLQRLQSEGHKVACVGPQVRFPGSRELSVFVRLGWIRRRREECRDASMAIECDFLIGSGTLIPMRVIEEVGGMEEDLFIDQVDTEWCLRARSMGYRVFGACGAILEHSLGETRQRIWLGRWRRLPRHKPFRYYYIFRNTLLLFGRSYVSSKWMLFQLQWLAALFLMYGVFSRKRGGELKMMLKGIVHGIRGVTGKLEHP
jgi:rhamnosyltransferase